MEYLIEVVFVYFWIWLFVRTPHLTAEADDDDDSDYDDDDYDYDDDDEADDDDDYDDDDALQLTPHSWNEESDEIHEKWRQQGASAENSSAVVKNLKKIQKIYKICCRVWRPVSVLRLFFFLRP